MKICWGLCGSFCTLSTVYTQIAVEVLRHSVFTVCSFNLASLDTRFGNARDHLAALEAITGTPPITTIQGAEPIGPKLQPDLMVIAPCTGNTLAKIAHGIFDTPVTLGAKAHLRSGKPLVIGLSTNDALSLNFKNLAELYQRKNIFFVPMKMDDPISKPSSLVCDFSLIGETIDLALEGKQRLPVFI